MPGLYFSGVGFIGILYTMIAWWTDVIHEAEQAAITPASCRSATATA